MGSDHPSSSTVPRAPGLQGEEDCPGLCEHWVPRWPFRRRLATARLPGDDPGTAAPKGKGVTLTSGAVVLVVLAAAVVGDAKTDVG